MNLWEKYWFQKNHRNIKWHLCVNNYPRLIFHIVVPVIREHSYSCMCVFRSPECQLTYHFFFQVFDVRIPTYFWWLEYNPPPERFLHTIRLIKEKMKGRTVRMRNKSLERAYLVSLVTSGIFYCKGRAWEIGDYLVAQKYKRTRHL